MTSGHTVDGPFRNVAVILGAGFSKAVSKQMPLTDELGKRVVHDLGAVTPSYPIPDFDGHGITFESWLSWLAERQPYLVDWLDLEDKMIFARARGVLARAISDFQYSAEREMSDWIYELIDLFHFNRTPVTTLNYDTLLENAFPTSDILTDPSGAPASIDDVVMPFPTWQRDYRRGGELPAANGSFDLYKLHGSIDWFAAQGDSSGDSLERIPADVLPPHLRELAVAGKEVFIVPPTTSKSGYYSNAKLRYIWQRAFGTLKDWKSVAIVGYSLPMADTTIAGMLARALGDSNGQVDVVNIEADAVVDRLISLGVSRDRIVTWSGRSAISDWIQDWAKARSRWTVNELTKVLSNTPDALVAFGWNADCVAQVGDASYESKTKVLTLNASTIGTLASLKRPSTSNDTTRTEESAHALRDVWPDGPVEQLRVRSREGDWWATGLLNLPLLSPDPVAPWIVIRALGRAPQ